MFKLFARMITLCVTDTPRRICDSHPMQRGEWISERLKALGKKKSELAEAIGLPASRVSEIISGRRTLKGQEIKSAARFLECSPEKLLEELYTGQGNDADDSSPAARPQENDADIGSEKFDPQVVHSVAWYFAELRGDDPEIFADLFTFLCEHIQNETLKGNKTDLRQMSNIIDFTLKRAVRP